MMIVLLLIYFFQQLQTIYKVFQRNEEASVSPQLSSEISVLFRMREGRTEGLL